MFESLSDKLEGVFKKLRSRGLLKEEDVDLALKEVRVALLEADVSQSDAVQRAICGRILSRFEDKGLKIVGMKMMHITPELAAQHYSAHQERPWRP